MAVLIECPKCKVRNSMRTTECKCGFNIKKAAGKIYWVEYYINYKRKRERIGPSKAAAENRLRKVLKSRAEDRYIDRNKSIRVTFDELSRWYLQLPQVKAKKSYTRDRYSVRELTRFFSGKVIKDITVNQVEAYRQKRLAEVSYRKNNVRPATVNREMACLRYMLNLAEQEGMIDSLPFKKLKALKENNCRDRILSGEEYEKLLSSCPLYTRQVVKVAYYTAMRQSEILNLRWDRVDLKNQVIRLRPEDTKTNDGRTIPLHPEVLEILRATPRHISGIVFTRDGHPLTDIKKSFKAACRKAGIEDFTFHDLRHTCINNWRLEGHDFLRIMAASGHKTMSVFKRYNTVSEAEIKRLVPGPMDTYVDTNEKGASHEIG